MEYWYLHKYLDILVILLLAFYFFIRWTCSCWNTPLYKYLCRKILVEGVRKVLLALADFCSCLIKTFRKEETGNGKSSSALQWVILILKWCVLEEEPLSQLATLFGNSTAVASTHQIIKWTAMTRLDLFLSHCILFYLHCW